MMMDERLVFDPAGRRCLRLVLGIQRALAVPGVLLLPKTRLKNDSVNSSVPYDDTPTKTDVILNNKQKNNICSVRPVYDL